MELIVDERARYKYCGASSAGFPVVVRPVVSLDLVTITVILIAKIRY